MVGRSLGIWVAVGLFWGSGIAFDASGAEANEKAERGASTYLGFCGSCHGRYGRGDGPLAGNLQVPLPDFSDSAWLGGRSDQQITTRLVSAPHAPMAIATLFKQETLLDSVAYIRTLSVPGKHVSLMQGRDIYNATCWVCHGENGDGKGPAANNMPDPQPRNFTSAEFVIEGREDEIMRTIALGPAAAFHGSAKMPEWGSQLTPQQIRDLVEFLRTFKQP